MGRLRRLMPASAGLVLGITVLAVGCASEKATPTKAHRIRVEDPTHIYTMTLPFFYISTPAWTGMKGIPNYWIFDDMRPAK